MKTKFSLLSLVVVPVAALFLAPAASAQVGPLYVNQVLYSGTFTNANQAVTNINAVADVGKQGVLAVQVSYVYNESQATNRIYIPFFYSVDGVNYETTPRGFFTITNNGSSRMTFSTNLSVEGFGYVKFLNITNWATTGQITNIVLSYGIKIGAP
jgi:hypothetical protein